MIKDNLEKIYLRIANACLGVKRNPEEIVLICVSKARLKEEIQQAISCGLKYFGENKVQEALLKYRQFPQNNWQMIGHLQTNKVKVAVKIFTVIHAVDSLGLAEEINRQAKKINKVQNVFLEVKTSSEATKFGFLAADLIKALPEIRRLNNLKVQGLMTIAPFSQNAQNARPYFRQLRQLRDTLDLSWLLSMGMSDDFEVAIEEGADIIRLGRAIFNG